MVVFDDIQKGEIDAVLFYDRSWSMDEKGSNGEANRFVEGDEYLDALLAQILPLDSDGITVYAFARRFVKKGNIKTTEEARKFLESAPRGTTNLGKAVADFASEYISDFKAGKAKKYTLALILCDGEVDDKDVLLKAIVDMANTIDRDERLAIGMIQVGNDSAAAKDMKLLDNKLNGDGTEANPGVVDFDIFDVKTVDDLDRFSSTKEIIEDFFNETHESN